MQLCNHALCALCCCGGSVARNRLLWENFREERNVSVCVYICMYVCVGKVGGWLVGTCWAVCAVCYVWSVVMWMW